MLQHLLNKQMLAICVIIAVAVFLQFLLTWFGITQSETEGRSAIHSP